MNLMARDGQVAVHDNAQPDTRRQQQHSYDAPNTPAQHSDNTPEIFRRFMTYESTMLTKQSPGSDDLGATGPMIDMGLSHPANPLNLSSHSPGTFRRPVRSMPKRAIDAPLAPSAAETTFSGLPRAYAGEHWAAPFAAGSPTNMNGPRDSVLVSPQAPTKPVPKQTADESGHLTVRSQTLSQRLEQLHVSPPDDLRTSRVDETWVSEAFKKGRDRTSPADGVTTFRFGSLPSKLTDDGFHYRQRAAQFILLCSQGASPERLSKLNRLSSPLTRSPSAFSKTGSKGAVPFAPYEENRSGFINGDENFHSHNMTYNASDDESEYLDFEACRTTHLCNKKKRKSSRYSSPGLPALGSMSSVDKSPQSYATEVPPHYPRNSTAREPGGALVDKTNTFQQSTHQIRYDQASKQERDFPDSAQLSSFGQPRFVRLPPRQTSGEYHKAGLRSRIRARLAHIFYQRKLIRIEQEARAVRDQQIRREAREEHIHLEAEAQESHSPGRRLPPKRMSKAGKRAQAIRGGSSPAKPLTIAEIRKRAAAAASGGGAQSSPNSAVKVKSSPSPSRHAPAEPAQGARSSTHGERFERKKDLGSPDSLPPSSAPLQYEQGASRSSSRADEQASAVSPHIARHNEAEKASARMAIARQSKLVVPVASFDFRMSSSVSLRLRELRAQLDTASRSLSDNARQANGHAATAVLGDTVAAAPPTTGTDSQPGHRFPGSTRYDHSLLNGTLPWVRGTLASQQQLELQQQGTATTTRQVRDPPPISAAPLREAPAASSHLRNASSTPPKNRSSTASPKATSASPPRTKSNAATDGRRGMATAVRKHGELTHRHGATCKHGHANRHAHVTGSGSNLFTDDDWICVFCEYELYYGETPLMLRACRNRKKLVEKKTRAKTKASAAMEQKKGGKSNTADWEGCHHHHDHDHEHDHRHHGCDYDHDYASQHEHGSTCGSYDCRDHGHHHHDDEHVGEKETPHRRTSHSKVDADHARTHGDGHRERCDCGNSIHSSDFNDDDSRSSTHL